MIRREQSTVEGSTSHETSPASTSSAPAPAIRRSISVRGQRYLQAADVVVYDHRVHARLLRAARPDAERIDVGAAAPQPLDQDAICLLLAEKAREGKTVVRLKWGDPFVFDSGGKEALFLHEQGIPFEVVPGIPVDRRRAGLRRHSDHLSRRRRRAHPRPRPREPRPTRRRMSTGASWPGSTARSSATPARGRSARSPRRCWRTAARRTRSAALIYDGDAAVAADDRRHARRRSPRASTTARRRCWSSARSSGCASTCAGSTSGRSSAAASSSRDRASRPASSSTCSRSAAPRRSRRRRSGSRRRRTPPRSTAACAEAGVVRLDRLHERQRRRLLHAAAARDRRRPRSEGRAALRGRRRRPRARLHALRPPGRPDAGRVPSGSGASRR